MSTTMTTQSDKPIAKRQQNPATMFRQQASQIATSVLNDWVGEERAKEATGRMAAAFAASAASARDPSDFYACTPQSVATCIAIAALTGIMPGTGSTALAYVVPQRARRGEAPQLQYSLSHRGLNALARRCGQTMTAIPIGKDDQIMTNSDGETQIVTLDVDNPPVKFDDLRGVMIVIKEIGSGMVLGRHFVSRKLIEQRRAMSRSFSGSNPQYSPWSTWPVEMAMKTGMHYAIGRGWCVIDDTSASRALTAEAETDLRDTRTVSGPATVGDLSNLISGPAQVDTDEGSQELQTTDELELIDAGPTGEESQEEPPYSGPSFVPLGDQEEPLDFTSRVKKALSNAATAGAVSDIEDAVVASRLDQAQADVCVRAIEKRRRELRSGK